MRNPLIIRARRLDQLAHHAHALGPMHRRPLRREPTQIDRIGRRVESEPR
jgi:hypothetical protein